MDGILNINKPPGMTSFAVVSRIKRICHEKHTGHAGTLDPIATGVLPICLGQATRVIEYLFDQTKTYRTEIKLGVTTDSFDSTGTILSEKDTSAITLQNIEAVLPRFRGDISQMPPMFSALKHNGQPLYKLAREGIEIERQSRPVHIYRLEIIEWHSPVLSLEIECSKGTYIRCIANDIGEALGCGGIMQGLVRTRVGDFKLEETLTLDQLEEAFKNGRGEKYLHAADYALQNYPVIIVKHEQQCSLVHGMPLVIPVQGDPDPAELGFTRAYNEQGDFVGMLKYELEKAHWQPHKIFIKQCCQQTESAEEP
jgi:tRNA pseudouridine55 synthase